MERFLLVRYCDSECEFPENENCLTVAQSSIFRCIKCMVKEVTRTWKCDWCQTEFSGFDEYKELWTAPLIKCEPDQKMVMVPLVADIKKVWDTKPEQRLNTQKAIVQLEKMRLANSLGGDGG